VLLVALLATLGRANSYRVDVRYAHNLIGGFDSKRDMALNAELSATIEYLEQLNFPEGQPSPFTGSLSYFVETTAEERCSRHYRLSPRQDWQGFGGKPETWIQEYGKK